jgi:hypothetical protein
MDIGREKIQPAQENNALQQYLQEYLALEKEDVKRIEILKTSDLPEQYKAQGEALNDKRLENITIAIIPDDLWMEGKAQPSESHAGQQLILIKKSYFEAEKNPDEIAWLLHELAHCQNFLDSESPEVYQKNMQTFAFKDLKAAYPYPNNLVEESVFTKQFQYLKGEGKTKEDILKMLGEYYNEEDTPFFNRLLDNIYS